MKRRIGIDSIFDKDKKGHYTRKALLYQNILQYAVRDDGASVSGSPFRHWNLSEWLMSKNNEFVNYYKDPSTKTITISNRIDNTQTRTKDKLDDLINLDLIEISGYTKQEKGTGQVRLYNYTNNGYLLAWIIESFDEKKELITNTKIYDVLNSIFNIGESSASPDIFFYSFFKKCYEQKAFGDIVGLFREILSSDKILSDTRDLLQHLVRLEFKDKDKAVFFLNLWNETLEELDMEVKNLFMYQLKLEIERRMEVQVVGTKFYEETRYSHRARSDLVTLECLCTKCNLFVPAGIRLVQYRKAHAYGMPITAKCPYCQTPHSLQVPALGEI